MCVCVCVCVCTYTYVMSLRQTVALHNHTLKYVYNNILQGPMSNPPQELNEEFRLTYCHLWLSILNHDTVRIKKYALELKGGELYPLLTCIIAARSWDSISKGVDASPVTNEEVSTDCNGDRMIILD